MGLLRLRSSPHTPGLTILRPPQQLPWTQYVQEQVTTSAGSNVLRAGVFS